MNIHVTTHELIEQWIIRNFFLFSSFEKWIYSFKVTANKFWIYFSWVMFLSSINHSFVLWQYQTLILDLYEGSSGYTIQVDPPPFFFIVYRLDSYLIYMWNSFIFCNYVFMWDIIGTSYERVIQNLGIFITHMISCAILPGWVFFPTPENLALLVQCQLLLGTRTQIVQLLKSSMDPLGCCGASSLSARKQKTNVQLKR